MTNKNQSEVRTVKGLLLEVRLAEDYESQIIACEAIENMFADLKEENQRLGGLLGECESVVTTFIHGVMDFKGCHREVKLMDKLSDTIVVMNKIRQLKAAKEGGE